jgi:hypothetical protein
VAALLRVITGSQNRGSLFVGIAIAAAIIAAAFAYARLRTLNSVIYVKEDRIGVSNAIGWRKELPIDDIDHIQECSVLVRDETAPMKVLLVVDKTGRCRLRFYGADSLQAGGIEEVSARTGLPVKGSWEEMIPLVEMEKTLPGSASRMLIVSGGILQHRTLAAWGIGGGTFVIGLIITVIYIARS